MLWRIYYADGSTFDDLSGLPHEAPAWGVIAIVQKCIESGRYITCAHDYYVHNAVQWFGVDGIGAIDYLVNHAHLFELPNEPNAINLILRGVMGGYVKVGRTVLQKTFMRIYNLADSDPDFPKRTAWHNRDDIPEVVRASRG